MRKNATKKWDWIPQMRGHQEQKCCISYLASKQQNSLIFRYILTVIKVQALQKLETTKILQHLQRTLKCGTCNIHIWLWKLFFVFAMQACWSHSTEAKETTRNTMCRCCFPFLPMDLHSMTHTLKALTRTKLKKQYLAVKVKNGLCQQQQQQKGDPTKKHPNWTGNKHHGGRSVCLSVHSLCCEQFTEHEAGNTCYREITLPNTCFTKDRAGGHYHFLDGLSKTFHFLIENAATKKPRGI